MNKSVRFQEEFLNSSKEDDGLGLSQDTLLSSSRSHSSPTRFFAIPVNTSSFGKNPGNLSIY